MIRPVYLILFSLIISLLSINFSFAQVAEVEEAFSERFERPLGIEYSHEGSSLLYIVGRSGNIVVKDIQNPDEPSTTFIDISDRVIASGELGLLGLAFSPNYQNDNTFYLYYAYEEDGEYYSTLARYRANNGVGDPESEERLFELLQPQDNHNGGQILFGPDGYMYVALGDGGRDSRNLAQDTEILNGSILRIDVSPETGYDIPSDNPFVGDPGGRDEIYAWGFRNPWRMSFDSETGNLWVADVGQKDMETLYITEKGKNYGWPIVEGTLCYPIGTEDCDKSGLEMPLFEYPWDEVVGRSITGGYVYRGDQNPSLYGKYIYGDFITRRIWALEIDHDTREVISNSEIALSGQNIPTFGVDSNGEIYIGGWAGGTSSAIYRFSPELTLTTLTLKTPNGSNTVELNWEVNNDSGIDSFELFRGPDMDDMELYDTIGGDSRQFSDPEPLAGATFYAMRAVEADGEAGELSNPVSFYRAQDTLINSWRLISIPFETDGLFLEDATIYSFDRSYILENELVPGRGYWARSTAEGGTQFTGEGTGIQSTTMQLKQGWNLIGAAVSPFPAESIIDEGDILNSTPVYGFNGSTLTEAESILPGQGYWIYADEEGEITIDLELEPITLPLVTASAGKENDSASFDTFEFSSASSSVKLHAAKGAVDPEVKNRFRVPPLSPDPKLDVRTTDGFRLVESNRFEPEITASEYPLSVRFTPGENTGIFAATDHRDVVYEVTAWRDGVSETSVLNPGTTLTLPEPADRIEFLMVEGQDEMVRKTELLPSYPNPFNPVTNLSYRIAEQQNVELSIYDATGRRVAVVLNEEQARGQYTVPFNASGLASGIYFVRFSAGDVLSTQKLTLIK